MKILYNQNQEAVEINSSLLQEELHKERLNQLGTSIDPRNLPHFDFQTNIFWYDESYLYYVTNTDYTATLTATPMVLTEQGVKPDNLKEETVLIASVDPNENDFERSFAKEAFRAIRQYLWG